MFWKLLGSRHLPVSICIAGVLFISLHISSCFPKNFQEISDEPKEDNEMREEVEIIEDENKEQDEEQDEEQER